MNIPLFHNRKTPDAYETVILPLFKLTVFTYFSPLLCFRQPVFVDVSGRE